MTLDEMYEVMMAYSVWSIANNLVTLFRSDQTTTRARKPFVILDIRNFQTKGLPTELEIDDNGIQRLRLDRSLTVNWTSFSDNLHQAEEILNRVKDRLHTEQARREYFKSQLVPRNVILGVQPIPQVESSFKESRAILEVEFAFSSNVFDDVGIIETIVVDNKIDDTQIIVSK